MLEYLAFLGGAIVFLLIVAWIQDRLAGDRMGFRGSFDWMMPAAIVIVLVVFAVWKIMEYRAR